MSSLYDLGTTYNAIYEQIYSDVPIEEIEAALMAMDEMIEEKADAYAKIIKSINADCDSIKAEEQRLAERRKALENKAESLKRALEEQMIATGKEKFKTTLFSFGIQNNPPSVNVIEESRIPAGYWVEQPKKLDKKLLLDDLKKGQLVIPDVVEIKQTKGLRIK